MKIRSFLIMLVMLFSLASFRVVRAEADPGSLVPKMPRGDYADAYSLIDEVNSLRASRGLATYSLNPILMQTAQNQADFMAAIGSVTHSGPGGIGLTQRLLNAGYPLAGDLTLGGMRSENITSGRNMTPAQAVQAWLGDAPHTDTMLSPNLTEIGAGVAVVGEEIYYVIDCARPTDSSAAYVSSTPDASTSRDTPAAGATSPVGGGAAPLVNTIVPATPDTDGKLYHIVQPGETLWLIAVSYGVKVADIRKLNGLAETAGIYPKMKLLIALMPAATPTLTRTPTSAATYTPAPTSTALPSPTLTPTPLEKVAIVTPKDSWPILAVIVAAALVLAGVLAASTRVRH